MPVCKLRPLCAPKKISSKRRTEEDETALAGDSDPCEDASPLMSTRCARFVPTPPSHPPCAHPFPMSPALLPAEYYYR
ncbi:hypothetical protein B296_00008620 [Ensete ventricosum]|uniref:Uncharacterized protein n=1 Tax=Ensete ventricosum TaxID=4639 RepID=A0A427A6L2_ENSVE|nr:hypothetical protein B296_00008620 [Ensete ventricosum]